LNRDVQIYVKSLAAPRPALPGIVALMTCFFVCPKKSRRQWPSVSLCPQTAWSSFLIAFVQIAPQTRENKLERDATKTRSKTRVCKHYYVTLVAKKCLSSFANSVFFFFFFKFGEFLPCPPDGMESVCPTFVRWRRRRRRRRHTWIRCWAPPPPRAQPLIKNSNQEQSVHGKLRYLGGVEEDEEKGNKKGRWRQTTPKSGEICSPVISKSIESATRQFKAHISTNQRQLGEWANC
jgi:hypothetical protein